MTERNPLQGVDIAEILSSSGPVVRCVLLRCRPPLAQDVATTTADDAADIADKADIAADAADVAADIADTADVAATTASADTATATDTATDTQTPASLPHLIEEIPIDTTPSKSMVSKTLGGQCTFLGQYEDEGIVLLVRKTDTQPHLDERTLYNDTELAELRAMCKRRNIGFEGMLEKNDLVRALLEHQRKHRLPVNPHKLHPPFHEQRVLGDILILKVAAVASDDDDDDDDGDGGDDDDGDNVSGDNVGGGKHSADRKPIQLVSNDEFFISYTKEQYLRFAARTDVVAPVITPDGGHRTSDSQDDDSQGDNDDDSHNNNNNEDDEDDEQDEDYRVGEDDEEIEIDEDDKAVMLNMVMNEVLRQYSEDNGHGPDTRELLEIRAALAEKLDVEVPHFDEDQMDWSKKAKRRKRSRGETSSQDGENDSEDEDAANTSSKRRVVFSPEVKDYDGERPDNPVVDESEGPQESDDTGGPSVSSVTPNEEDDSDTKISDSTQVDRNTRGDVKDKGKDAVATDDDEDKSPSTKRRKLDEVALHTNATTSPDES